ncbi:hypothetical protein JCM8547_002220 [Rhodosporidiobolus lusitaniae]
MSTEKKTLYTPLPISGDAPPAYEAAAEDASSLETRIARLAQQQPAAVPQMTVVGGYRNPKELPIGFDGKRTWNHSLCSWYETPGLTAGAVCCPCIIYSSNRSRLHHLQQIGSPNSSPQYLGVWCGLYALSPQFFGIGQVALQFFSRWQTRERYGVRGNVVEDALVGAFCTTCSLVQESRELEDEEIALYEGRPAPHTMYRDEEEAVAAGPSSSGTTPALRQAALEVEAEEERAW